MNPPPNPHAAEARADIAAYQATLRQDAPRFDYYLTWPAQQAAVCCVANQWRRNEAGDIEAWYTAAQLRDALAALSAAQAAHDAPEGKQR